MKRYKYVYWQHRSMTVDVVAETEEEAEQKLKDMELSGSLDLSNIEVGDSGFDYLEEKSLPEGRYTEDGLHVVDFFEQRFDGDILITDPCYLAHGKKEDWAGAYWGWICSNPPDDDGTPRRSCVPLRTVGIDPVLVGHTVYGDWSCTVFDADGNEIGEFTADSGMYILALWDQVKKALPDMEEWVRDHSWCAAVVRDFHGTVRVLICEDPIPKQYVHEGVVKTYLERSVWFEGIADGKVVWTARQTGA